MARKTPEPRRTDDPESIPDDALLYRVLYEENWSHMDGDVRRVSSHAFKDTLSFEASCFLAAEKPLSQLKEMFPGKRICVASAGEVRKAQHIIARAPEDGDASHVVLCPPGDLKRSDADRLYAQIAAAARIVDTN